MPDYKQNPDRERRQAEARERNSESEDRLAAAAVEHGADSAADLPASVALDALIPDTESFALYVKYLLSKTIINACLDPDRELDHESAMQLTLAQIPEHHHERVADALSIAIRRSMEEIDEQERFQEARDN